MFRTRTDTFKYNVDLVHGDRHEQETSADIIWKNANDFYNDIFFGYFKNPRFEVETPLALDLVIPAPVPLNIYQMTGDITRCIGWMLLSPESIR